MESTSNLAGEARLGTAPDPMTNLRGKKVVITALDLEQEEHRGIAVYSKALIQTLANVGAEVWLLTQFAPQISKAGIKRLPEATQEMIATAGILDALGAGPGNNHRSWLEKKFHLARKTTAIWRWVEKLFATSSLISRHYPESKIKRIYLHSQYDNPYLRSNRLGYLKNIQGILCARNIYEYSMLRAARSTNNVWTIDLTGFDAFITTCPLNIKPTNANVFIQTIHDLIPLEYAQTSDAARIFARRLQACLPARKLFVSESTAYKYAKAFGQGSIANQSSQDRETVVVQPASLTFQTEPTEAPGLPADIIPCSKILQEASHSEDNTNDRKSKFKRLKPFQYLLFNSSVEPRKNLLFLAQAYSESNLSKQGIKLCVTGKLKRDQYSVTVKRIMDEEPGIITTGYINETEKHDLYLNALALMSPSLVEGFGIPVLDAACLGLPSLVSDSESHREIRELYDFQDHIHLCSTLESRNWANAMQLLASTHQSEPIADHQLRQKRLSRYHARSKTIQTQFQKELSELLLSNQDLDAVSI